MTEAAGNPTIAAVIPAFNRADTLERALRSALSQDRLPDEIVVVDDGSTDGTEAIAGSEPTVTLVRQPHRGVAAARNEGVARSSSQFIAFLDSDDVWDPDHLRRMHDAIVATDAVAWLYFSDLRLAPLHGGATSWDLASFEIGDDYDLRYDGAPWVLLPRQPMMISGSVLRRDAYDKVGGSDEKLARRGDTHLFFKLGLGGPICAVAGEAGMAKDDAANSLTRTLSSDSAVYWNCTVWLYRDVIERARDAGLALPLRSELERSLAHGHLALARQMAPRPRAVPHVVQAIRYDPRLVARRAARLVASVL